MRPLSEDLIRLELPTPLPLRVGDRGILRDPGGAGLLGGGEVLDPDPPELRRRGAAGRRATDLATIDALSRRKALLRKDLLALGFSAPAEGAVAHGDWLIDPAALTSWATELQNAVRWRGADDPLRPSIPAAGAVRQLNLPDQVLLDPIAAAAGLVIVDGRVGDPTVRPILPTNAEKGLRVWENRWQREPFLAPEAEELVRIELGTREIAAAAELGRVLRLPGEVLLAPRADAHATVILAALTQPFTASQARQALGTTRRVALPLLEHLDRRGWTRRVDSTLRTVVRSRTAKAQD